MTTVSTNPPAKPPTTRSPLDQPATALAPLQQPAGTRSPLDQPATALAPLQQPAGTRAPLDLPATRTPLGAPASTRRPPSRPISLAAPLVPPAVLPQDSGAKVVRAGEATVRVRPVAPDDGAALAAALQRMSLRTRWLRFHSPITRFSRAQLRMLLDADHRHREVLVAEVELGPARWQLIGFAQYARIAPDRADAAIVLEDAWQGRGIGRELALELVAVARSAGIAAFTSEILTENHRTLKFARALAPRHEGRLLGVTTELTVWLDPA